eukprot:GFUD01055484.1.p1 GENE.GFUD01055484.1~~GFUD01055484.1.p1  ORF type:complete len:620 (-),score=86.20 GFUD01055484.1:6-1865(-)
MRTCGAAELLRVVILLLLFLYCARSKNSLQSQAKQLLSLLAPAPAVGEPWPSIPGPELKDRVCIVGAGASGIHMALSLKKRSYENVVVFEKSIRVGGKCYDVNYRGTPNAQGANFLEANYFNEDNLVPVLREYGLDDLVPVPITHVWATNSATDPGSKLTPSQFVLGTISKMTNSTSPEVNLGFYLQTVIRYIQLHKEMFGLYEGDLMQRPTPEVLHRIRGTLLDFLTRENLLGMIPIFQMIQTLPGYGQLDEIGTLYGLIWHNPRLVMTVALSAIKQEREPFAQFSLKKGFENVWKTIVEKENFDIRFQTDIVSIQREESGVYLQTWQNFKAKTEFCDFLIWTPEVSQLLRSLDMPTEEEKHLLGSLTPEVFYAHLINVEGGVRHAPKHAFMANVLSKEDYAVTWTADTAGLLTPGIKTPEGMAKYNSDTGLRTLYALHAPSKHYTSEEFLKRKMRDHLIKGFNVSSVEFLNTVAWTYFPRWTPAELVEGRHWDVFKIQGHNRIWYAGVSASYESVRSVISYNNRLLKQMVPRNSLNPISQSFVRQGAQPISHNQTGSSTSINVNNCRYSCSTSGGCKVRYVGPSRHGYTLGACGPSGACGGTPRECRQCNTVIKCYY